MRALPSFADLALIVVILVIVFGMRRLPALGEAIGRALAGTPAKPSDPEVDSASSGSNPSKT